MNTIESNLEWGSGCRKMCIFVSNNTLLLI